jgi:hypothetical protein
MLTGVTLILLEPVTNPTGPGMLARLGGRRWAAVMAGQLQPSGCRRASYDKRSGGWYEQLSEALDGVS